MRDWRLFGRQILTRGLAVSIMGFLASGAGAFDLTGTWEGKMACNFFDGEKGKQPDEGTLEITQRGTVVHLRDNIFAVRYAGRAIEALANPDRGEVNFVQCGMTDNPAAQGEVGRAVVKTNPDKGTGKFKAMSIFYDGGEIDTCKWTYKRVSRKNPGVPGCP